MASLPVPPTFTARKSATKDGIDSGMYTVPVGYIQGAMRRLLLVLPLLSACDATAPKLPAGAERFTPPAVYQQWWKLTEQCSGLSSNMSDVTWYRVPGAAQIPLTDGTLVNGRWDPVGNRIILAGDSQLEGDLVRHEMLHALLHSGGHPRSVFIGRCGGTVVCTEQCLTDGGAAPPPDPTARMVSPHALEIGVEVIPQAPSSSVNDGTFMMFVTARNTAASPVVVQLPPAADAGPGVSFSCYINGDSGWSSYYMRAEAPEVTRFAAFEVKRFIFDFRVSAGSSRYDVSPGTYLFNGAYGGAWAPNPPAITVSP